MLCLGRRVDQKLAIVAKLLQPVGDVGCGFSKLDPRRFIGGFERLAEPLVVEAIVRVHYRLEASLSLSFSPLPVNYADHRN